MSEQQDARALMGMEIPDELANLFYGLTGTQWPKVDEDRLRDFSDAYATVEYILATELPDLVLVLRRKVQSTFDSQTTEYFENSLAQFTAGERNYIGEAAELAAEIRQYAKDAANQVEYAKWMIIGQLIQLALEIAWAIATAKFTFGASLKFIPLFKFIKSQIIRRILNWLVWNLLSHLFIAQMFGVTMDLLIQRIQMDQGNRDEWDKELTRMAAAGAFVEGLLSAGLSFGADLFLSGQLAKLFGDNLPDPPGPPPPTRDMDIVTDPPAGPPGRVPDPETLVTPPPRDIPDPDAPPPPRKTPDPTPPPREAPEGGPDTPPARLPPPAGSITPEFNRDLVNLFARNSNEFLNAAQRPNTASVGMDHARRFVDGSSDVFARHFGGTIGDAAARNLGRDYADTLLRTWNTPRTTSALDDVMASAPLPQSTRDYLARDVPDAFGRTVTDFGSRWSDRATALGIGAASGAFEGYVGEGLTNLWFSPEQEWKASGMSAVAGASTSVVHDLAVSGGLKGLDSLSDLRDLNNRPAPDLGGAGPGPAQESRGPASDDASDSSSGWESPPGQGGNRSFESQDEPILRLRGGGSSVSSFESYDGDGDDVSTIAPSDRGEDSGELGGGEDREGGQDREGGERSAPRNDTSGTGGDRERPGQQPAPTTERQEAPRDDAVVVDHTDGTGRSPAATAGEPAPAAQDTGRARDADSEEGSPRPNDGSGQSRPRSSQTQAEDIDIGEFFRSLNGDAGETGAEGAPVPPPVVAAPVSAPPGAPASPPSSPTTPPAAPGTSPSRSPESAGSETPREGAPGTEETGGPGSTTHEDVLAPTGPPGAEGDPSVTGTGDTSSDAERASDDAGVPRTESAPAPPESAPAAPAAEQPSSGSRGPEGDGSDGEGSDPGVPPAGEELGPVPPAGEEDPEPASPNPENAPTGHEDVPTAQGGETPGEGPEEAPANDPGQVPVGEGGPVNPQREDSTAEGEQDVSSGPLPPPAESEGTALPDTPVVGTSPPVEPPTRRSSEAETPRSPKPDGVRDPLRAPTDSEKGPRVRTEPVTEEVSATTDPVEGSAPRTPPATESESGPVGPRGPGDGPLEPSTEVRGPEEKEPEEKEPEEKDPKGKEPEVEGPEPKGKEPEAKEAEAEGSETKGPEPRKPTATETEDPGEETLREPESGTSRTPKEAETPERTPETPAPPARAPAPAPAPAPPTGTTRTEEDAGTHRLNYLINARWVESYGVRVDPDTVLDTFPGLPDDVRALLGNDLATDPRDFFLPDGVRVTSSDGRTYTLRLSSDDAWRSGGRDRPGATTAKYKGLHDEQTQSASGGSGLSGKARRPVVGFQANLFGVDAIPAPVVGARVSAFRGSAVQEQSGGTNHTQLLTTEMVGVGETYSSVLTASWQVEGGPTPAVTAPVASGGTGPDAARNPPPVTVATEGPEGIELVTRPNPPTTTVAEGADGAGPNTSPNPPPATTTTEGVDGTAGGGTMPPPPPPLPPPGAHAPLGGW